MAHLGIWRAFDDFDGLWAALTNTGIRDSREFAISQELVRGKQKDIHTHSLISRVGQHSYQAINIINPTCILTDADSSNQLHM